MASTTEKRLFDESAAAVARYTIECHWPDGKVTTADFDHVRGLGQNTLIDDIDNEMVWRVTRVEDMPEPYVAKLVLAPHGSLPPSLASLKR
jgi:hypothetical protein